MEFFAFRQGVEADARLGFYPGGGPVTLPNGDQLHPGDRLLQLAAIGLKSIAEIMAG